MLDKELLKEQIEEKAFKITTGFWNERIKTGTEISIRKDTLSDVIDKTFDESLPIVPVKVALYLAKDMNCTLHQKITYLLESYNGDQYYFCEMMPDDLDLTQEHGEWLFSWSQQQTLEYLFSLVNGYKIEGVD